MIDVVTGKCAGLHVSNSVIFGQRLSSFFCYLSLTHKITFVCNKNSFNIFVRVFFDFPHPFRNVVKCFFFRDVIHHHDTQGTAVVSCCDGMEPTEQNKMKLIATENKLPLTKE